MGAALVTGAVVLATGAAGSVAGGTPLGSGGADAADPPAAGGNGSAAPTAGKPARTTVTTAPVAKVSATQFETRRARARGEIENELLAIAALR
jgi:hypothetical protein